jgi:hypothetical protein
VSPFEIVATVLQALGLIGVGVAVSQLGGLNRQQHREFEQLYVQRYWSIRDRFSDEFALGPPPLSLSPSDEAVAMAYLQLCEDEIDMYLARRVTDSTWKVWESGMRPQLMQEPYRTMLEHAPAGSWPSIRRLQNGGTPNRGLSTFGLFWRGLS